MNAMQTPGPIWFVGAGNMGGAMLTGLLAAGLDPRQVTVVRSSDKPFAPGVTTLAAPPPDGPVPRVVVLGVKPQMLHIVAPALAALLAPETLLVSILAGVDHAGLRARFATPTAILRVMPNTPVAIGKGVLALNGQGLDAATADAAAALFAPLGAVEWIADEAHFDIVTALSGSGPGFLFRFIDALARGGAALGLPADQAARLALATVEGAAALAAQAEEPPAKLADRVASPGGSTRAGFAVLDAGLDALILETLAAATKRNAELAAAAR